MIKDRQLILLRRKSVGRGVVISMLMTSLRKSYLSLPLKYLDSSPHIPRYEARRSTLRCQKTKCDFQHLKRRKLDQVKVWRSKIKKLASAFTFWVCSQALNDQRAVAILHQEIAVMVVV